MTQKRLHLVRTNEWPVRMSRSEMEQSRRLQDSIDRGEDYDEAFEGDNDNDGDCQVVSNFKRRLELHLDRYMDLDKKRVGQYFGADAILSSDHKLKVSVRAIGYVHVLLLTRQDLMEEEKLFCKQLVHSQTHSKTDATQMHNASEQRIVEKMRSLEQTNRKQLHLVLAKGPLKAPAAGRDQVFTDWDWSSGRRQRFRDLILEPQRVLPEVSIT